MDVNNRLLFKSNKPLLSLLFSGHLVEKQGFDGGVQSCDGREQSCDGGVQSCHGGILSVPPQETTLVVDMIMLIMAGSPKYPPNYDCININVFAKILSSKVPSKL